MLEQPHPSSVKSHFHETSISTSAALSDASPLNHYRVLLADADQQLSHVLTHMLGKMGFTHVRTTQSGRDALKILADQPVDFLITEWDTKDTNGIDVVDHVRRESTGGNPALPVMMLTGRAEQSDVMTARDHGVNEYVVKPFSARSIYRRLENLIEQPREFVVSKDFVGPNRRRKSPPPAGVEDRRGPSLEAQIQPAGTMTFDHVVQPQIWLPDFLLKKKLGNGGTLASLITPTVLSQAQTAIDAITDDALAWVKENLREIGFYAIQSMIHEEDAPIYLNKITDTAALIHSRAGTFGYTRASQVAYMLYIFCRNHAKPHNTQHLTVINKHIEVLQVILGNKMTGMAGEQGDMVVAELRKLINKYIH